MSRTIYIRKEELHPAKLLLILLLDILGITTGLLLILSPKRLMPDSLIGILLILLGTVSYWLVVLSDSSQEAHGEPSPIGLISSPKKSL